MQLRAKVPFAGQRAGSWREVLKIHRIADEHQQERRSLALQQSRASTWTWNLSTDAFCCSGETEGLYGHRGQSPPRDGAGWLRRIHRDDRERVAEAFSDCREGRSQALCIEYRVSIDQTRSRWSVTRGGMEDPLGPDSRVMIGTTVDITALRTGVLHSQATEGALRRQMFEAIGQISGGVAHDLNNLLGIISNLSELQRRSGDMSRSVELSSKIVSTAARGALLTRKLFQLAKPGGASKVALAEDLGSVIDLMRISAGGGVEVRLSIGDEVWPVHVDASQLQLAVMNLAINSGHAMPDGGTFTVSALNAVISGDRAKELKVVEGEFVEVQLSDTGQGMSPDTLHHAFEPYFTTKTSGQGTGLGLAQVRAFARTAGGSAQARSVLGVGTTVSIYLPRERAVAGVA